MGKPLSFKIDLLDSPVLTEEVMQHTDKHGNKNFEILFEKKKKDSALQAEEEKGPWPTPPEAYLPIQWASLFKTHIASSNSKRPHVFRIALIFRIFKI